MPQYGDIKDQEHDDADVNAKRIKLYGWDGTNWLKVVVDADGKLKVTT